MSTCDFLHKFFDPHLIIKIYKINESGCAYIGPIKEIPLGLIYYTDVLQVSLEDFICLYIKDSTNCRKQ